MKIIIIGAGPAGLTAAWEAEKRNVKTVILESDVVVGGISRTVTKNGWKFDIGGHRFFTKVSLVNTIWREILSADDFLLRHRMSRIFYKKKFFDYPLKLKNALFNLGIIETIRCVLSYFYVKIFPPKDTDSFETWVASRFGWRLYNIFFKTYTEKVWGIPANQIGSDWASQRIKNLSIWNAITSAIFTKKNSKKIITTLIDKFHYPKLGPGMMWEEAERKLTKSGHKIFFKEKVVRIEKNANKTYTVWTEKNKYEGDYVISTMPLAHLPKTIEPKPANKVVIAGNNLYFRDFLSVALVVGIDQAFPDNWVYIHDPDVKVGRVQNYGSWSPFLVKENKTCLGLEYFVTENDEMWSKSDAELKKFAINEIETLGLVKKGSVEEAYVVKMPKAYPVYDLEYKKNIDEIRKWLVKEHPAIFPVGRNGLHRYNNQDHSMLSAVYAIRNIFGGKNDIWNVNVEKDYHEEKVTDRSVPIRKKK